MEDTKSTLFYTLDHALNINIEMKTWESVTLYTFLGLIVFHLVIDDVIVIIKIFRKKEPCNQQQQQQQQQPQPQQQPQQQQEQEQNDVEGGESGSPAEETIGDVYGEPRPTFLFFENTVPYDVEAQTPHSEPTVNSVLDATAERNTPIPFPYIRGLGSARQKTLVVIVYKICDVILYCVMGYYHAFTICWCSCLNCLKALVLGYFNFLDSMIKQITAPAVVPYVCATAVMCLAIASIMMYILVSAM